MVMIGLEPKETLMALHLSGGQGAVAVVGGYGATVRVWCVGDGAEEWRVELPETLRDGPRV